MANPKVSVTLNASNLGIIGAGEAGTFAIIAAIAAANTSGYGVPVLIKSKAQAAAELADAANAALLTAIQKGFYGEVAEGTPLYCIFVSNSNMLADIADVTNNYFSALQNFSLKKIRAFALLRIPQVGETPTITDGFDEDVHTAVPKAQEAATAWINQNKLIDVLVQGKGFTNETDALDYSAEDYPQTHIVIGNVDGNEMYSVLQALGRKAAFDPHKNIGRVLSGSLSITSAAVVKLGATKVSDYDSVDLDTLHDKRYIFYVVNENAAGYIFNDDLSLTAETSDYGTWANNAVIGEAMRIAYGQYYKSINDDVDVDENGRIATAIEKNLEQDVEDAINKQMGGSISAVSALVNPDPETYPGVYANANISTPNLNLLSSGGKVYIFLTIRPKGYLKDINIFLGFGL